ncbi:AT DNA binding protein [Blastomyces dermatitidis ATCC 18188]|uniref:Thymocyte nuclear protein 1 n=1 Tax=Ajellomyces dermatitidis (strain ATCC 18188 / CBS 674.68) TaxID=653446 RepID=F2TIS5_AJEDA|nr:AT DNA binding protein [Blastomyces dermatitidis ATCC 18188]
MSRIHRMKIIDRYMHISVVQYSRYLSNCRSILIPHRVGIKPTHPPHSLLRRPMPPKRRQSTTVVATATPNELSQNDAKKPRLSSRNPVSPVAQTAASSRPKRASRAHAGKEYSASEPSEGIRKRASGANAGKTKQEEATTKAKQHGSGAVVSLNGIETEPKNKNTVDETQDEADDTKSHWLMKAEPESRIEKGIDVRFSIDDLRGASEPEPWDGVRNPTARNNMRAMKKGDLAFFYHSNCKVPGIAGIMEIVREHSVDESAFDPAHPYYDPKSNREKPKWELVHVEFRRKFRDLITLAELKSFAKPGGPLENMQMMKQSRLSVSAVNGKEWRFIMGLAGEE